MTRLTSCDGWGLTRLWAVNVCNHIMVTLLGGRPTVEEYYVWRMQMRIHMNRTGKLVYAGLFVALMAVGAFIHIMLPIGPFSVTFSLQLLFALMAGIMLGAKVGFFSVACYLVLGLLGVPIFAHGGGLGYVMKPTFGFLIGFAMAALLCGFLYEKLPGKGFMTMLFATFCGEMVYYVCGLIYYYIMFDYILGNTEGIGIKNLFLVWFLPTVLPDFLLCVLASVLAVRLFPVMRRLNEG